jgi:iron(III) transport system substrate-binding protein
MLKMRTGLVLIAVFFMVSAVQAATRVYEQVYRAAEKEGEVIWVSTLREKEADPIVKVFNKEHPNIKATHIRQHGGQAMERLMREMQTGTVPYDIAYIHPDYLQEFLKLDAIERADWVKDFDVLPEFVQYDNRFVCPFSGDFAIVYNTNLIRPEDAPKNWEDLLDPKWKGKFIFDTRPSAFLRLTGAWGPEKTLDYLRKLGKNKPIFVRGQTKAATLMAAGDYMMSSAMYVASYAYVKSKGGPLAVNAPDPFPADRFTFGILKGAKHPNAARILNGWLGSKGYKMMDDINWGWSAPFPGSRKEKLYKGKTIAYPPTEKQVPDRHKYTLEMLKAVGVRKGK